MSIRFIGTVADGHRYREVNRDHVHALGDPTSRPQESLYRRQHSVRQTTSDQEAYTI